MRALTALLIISLWGLPCGAPLQGENWTTKHSYGYRLYEKLKEENAGMSERELGDAVVAFEYSTDRYRVNKRIAYNVIWHEGRFKTTATHTNYREGGRIQIDRGLMQISDETSDWGGWRLKLKGNKKYSNPSYDPTFNIRTGVAWLAHCIGVANGDIKDGLIAYGAGPSILRAHRTASKLAQEVIDHEDGE